MDAKALAKSKRAHSLHHSKKPQSNQKSKAPSSAGATSDSGRGKQGKEKPRQSALPSNWDRYEEEEFEMGSDDPLGGSRSKASDVVLPKSKGADYRHLIAEAQSQSQSQFQSNSYFDIFPSLEDILPGDFNNRVAQMLSVRGEGILSWIGDNNFIVEDEPAASHETSFLSLNLHALAEQLAKVDVSERLFIEPDLLPSELSGQGSNTSSCQESDHMQTSESQTTASISEELAFQDFSENNVVVNRNTEVIWSDSEAGRSNPISFNQGLDISNQVRGDPNAIQDGKSGQINNLESTVQVNMSSVADPRKKLETFEATTAEAELDILLESFGETMLLDSSGFNSGTLNHSVSQKDAPISVPQPAKNAPGSSKTTSMTANLDDIRDDLLEQTSNLLNQNGLLQPSEPKSIPNENPPSDSSQSVTKSKVLDDFDSWLDTI